MPPAPPNGTRPSTTWTWTWQTALALSLPPLLWALSGNPIPHRFPAPADINTWWNTLAFDPTQALSAAARLLADLLWIAWAWYTLWLAIAAVWLLLRLPAVAIPRVLLMITPRTAVHALTLGAALTSQTLHAAPAHAVALAGAHETLTARLDKTASSPAPSGHALSDASSTHIVATGDTLWDLAHRYYGDGEQWHRLYTANIHTTQPDGRRLADPDLLEPGWRLTIPRVTAGPADRVSENRAQPDVSAATQHLPGPDPAVTKAHLGVHGTTTPEGVHIPTPLGRLDPHAGPRSPRPAGWTIPEGGYAGVTLLTAIAASLAVIRARNRRHPARAVPIPAAAERLAAVHAAAVAADTYGYHSDEHPGEQPPPTAHTTATLPTLGTTAGERSEIPHDPSQLRTPLAYTGPGAEDAVRAFAIATLAADPASSEAPHALLIDYHLAHELLELTPADHTAGWLHLVPTTTDAAHELLTAAETSRTRAVGEQHKPGHVTLLARAESGTTGLVADALARDTTATLAAILLAHPGEAPGTTELRIDEDGTLESVIGLDAPQITAERIHTLPRDTAVELYQVLRNTRVPLHLTGPAGAPPGNPSAPVAAHDHEIEPTIDEPATGPAPQKPTDSAPNTKAPQLISATSATPPTHTRSLTDKPLIVRILGPIDILGPACPTPVTGDKAATVLALLALHPDGHTAAQLGDLAWNNLNDTTGTRPVYTAISRARTPLRQANNDTSPDKARYITQYHSRFRLDTTETTTDLALWDELEHHSNQSVDIGERLDLLTKAVRLYRGPLAQDLDDHNLDWLATARIDATNRTVRHRLTIADLTKNTDPATTIHHLDTATRLVPDDEETAIRAMRVHHELGRPDLAQATYQRLESALRTLAEEPSRDARQARDGRR